MTRTKIIRIRPADRAVWRAWLAAHHATETEAFVEFGKKGNTTPTVTYPEAVEEALCFGWIAGVRHKVDDKYYSNRFTPRRTGSAWSEINKAHVARLEAAGLMHAAGLAAIAAAKTNGTWIEQTSIGDAIPAELAAMFTRFPKAKRAYAALAPGQQKMWRHWVGTAKQAKTRDSRAARAIGKLEAGAKLPI